MIDLSAISGLPIALDDDQRIVATVGGLQIGAESVPTVADLAMVLEDPTLADREPDRIAYRVYRDVRMREHDGIFARFGLRYDITVILPGLLGAEFPKTAGHSHCKGPDRFDFAELYEVLTGRVAFVQQWQTGVTSRVSISEPGEIVEIDPDSEHLSINIGDGALVFSNLIARACENDYSSMRRHRGGAWYLHPDSTAADGIRFVRNHCYEESAIPTVTRMERSVRKCEPLYLHFVRDSAFFRRLAL